MSLIHSRPDLWARIRRGVLIRDQYVCAYCGGRATQVDHVLSRMDGGGDEPSNLVACCAPCNKRKGAGFLERRGSLDASQREIPPFAQISGDFSRGRS